MKTFRLKLSFMRLSSDPGISAHVTNASKLICEALSSNKWHLLSVIVALILVLAQCCRMNTDCGCQVCTFEADGDALAERLSDQVPGG